MYMIIVFCLPTSILIQEQLKGYTELEIVVSFNLAPRSGLASKANRAAMVTRPQAPPRGQLGRDDELLIASMHLSMRRYIADISWLMEEVELLMRQAHIVVLTGINAFWMKGLRDKLKLLATSQDRGDWDFRFDDEAVCVFWRSKSIFGVPRK